MKTDMGIRKWSWPGYLTFGKSAGRKPPEIPTVGQEPKQKSVEKDEEKESKQHVDVSVDQNALEDAISSKNTSKPVDSDRQSLTPAADVKSDVVSELPESYSDTLATPLVPTAKLSLPLPLDSALDSQLDGEVSPATGAVLSNEHATVPSKPPSPVHELLSITVHLSESDNVLATRRRKLFYAMVNTIPPSLLQLCV